MEIFAMDRPALGSKREWDLSVYPEPLLVNVLGKAEMKWRRGLESWQTISRQGEFDA
jgi:hypothetical protein